MTAPDPVERELLTRVLDALLREDAYRLRRTARTEHHPDGDWLRLAVPGGARLPVEPDGFQCEVRVRRPLLATDDGTAVTGLRPVLERLRPVVAAQDRPGFEDFAAECAAELAVRRVHRGARREVTERLALAYGPAAADWTGPRGALAYDALAAFRDHPVYPTGHARNGLTEPELRPYAPEFHRGFALRWLLLPRPAVHRGPGPLPPWWPTPARLGLPGDRHRQLALPVHPLTAGEPLTRALNETGLADTARLAPRPWLTALPTLSMRTVALAGDPATHLKLPLATATLGLRNRRTIKPGTLDDGALAQRLLETVLGREPRFASTVLLADEGTHLGAGHELLAALVRRLPGGLERAQVVPVAALLARTPDGGLVADALAGRHYHGSLPALLDAALTLLLDWHTTLFGYGIALEAHQQNTSLVLDRDPAGRTRLRLLLKDNDGPRINSTRLLSRLGDRAAPLLAFGDRRITVADDGPVADVFTTITLHLCAGALAFELDRLGRIPLAVALRRIRQRLERALSRIPPDAAAVLRTRVLDADRLPVKAMITAGTLLSKERSGAADINKHYVDGPNYLRHPLSLEPPR
ncbi:IucA/IucC family protein [Streptomyces orinoci]|uniref:IucA/IucC family protein n=1 Tax=Streptomyces orinoci TaxID=67339 RepID=A0ABV3K4H8_STRON|nr:IucA/IucC family protein [Streptomyces orinoci]